MTDEAIDRSADILGGTPVFSGTRVPVRILIEYLEAGDRLDDFLDSFPTVSRSQAIEVLERAKAVLAGHSDETAASPAEFIKKRSSDETRPACNRGVN